MILTGCRNIQVSYTSISRTLENPIDILLKEPLTVRLLKGGSMDVVFRLIHNGIGAIHKRHGKEKEKLNP
jgi:hypothetical protein